MRDKLSYHNYCGPAVVAQALNITRQDAAAILQAVATIKGRRKRRAGTYCDEVAVALRSEQQKIPRKEQVTLGEWAYHNRHFTGVVNVSNHFIYMEDGRILEDNGVLPWGGLVRVTIPYNGS